MKTLNPVQSIVSITLLMCLSASSAAQRTQLPIELTAKEISPEISLAIKLALDESSMPCGLEGAHEEHAHENKLRSVLLSREPSLTSDSARKLIFSQKDLSEHQLLSLVETLGALNAENTDQLLRSIYQHADTLASRFTPDDIEDATLKQMVKNSAVEDIRSSVMTAISKNKSKNLADIVSVSARGKGHVAAQAQDILKSQIR